MTTYTGSDGLTYDFTNNVLTISGSGTSTSLRNGYITLSDGTTQIDVASVTTVEVGANVGGIGYSSFTDIYSVYYYMPSRCTALSTINVASGHTKFRSINGIMYWTVKVLVGSSYRDVSALYYYPPGRTDTTYTTTSDCEYLSSDAFTGNPYLQTVTLQSNIYGYEGYTFRGCTALRDVYFNFTITSFRNGTFDGCTSLTADGIHLVSWGVTSIGLTAFRGCTSMTSFDCDDFGAITTIGANAFYYCLSLNKIKMCDETTSVGQYAFDNCPALKEMWIPISVNASNIMRLTPYHEGQYNISSLETVYFLGSSSSSSPSAGYDYTSSTCLTTPWYIHRSTLKEVHFSQYLTIGAYTFYGTLVEAMSITSNVPSIGSYAFSNTGLVYMFMESGITNIGDHAFYGSSGLEGLIFRSATAPTIGTDAFVLGTSASDTAECIVYSNNNWAQSILDGGQYTTFTFASQYGKCGDTVLWAWTQTSTSGAIKGKLIIAGRGPMYDYTTSSRPSYESVYKSSTTEVEVEEGVTSIGKYAFYTYSALMTLTLAGTVAIIDDAAFYASGLRSVTLPEGVETLKYGAFNECSSLTSASLPSTLTDLGIQDSGAHPFDSCPNLGIISVTDGNPAYSAESNILYNADKTQLLRYAPKRSDAEYTILASVTSLAYSAFQDASLLNTIIIPKNVAEIESGCFTGCYNVTKIIFKHESSASLSSDSFMLSSGSPTASAKVYSKNNWAASVLSTHPNAYTTLFFMDPDPQIFIRDAVWKKDHQLYVKVNGKWILVSEAYMKSDGTWRKDFLSIYE